MAEAERRGLRIGCAPDIFLGGAYQAARALLDEGAIGEPLAVERRDARRRAGVLAPEPGHLLRATAPGRCSTWGPTT